jgi:hypothetical protein
MRSQPVRASRWRLRLCEHTQSACPCFTRVRNYQGDRRPHIVSQHMFRTLETARFLGVARIQAACADTVVFAQGVDLKSRCRFRTERDPGRDWTRHAQWINCVMSVSAQRPSADIFPTGRIFSQVPIADIRRTSTNHRVRTSQSSSLSDGPCPAAEAVWLTLLDPICRRAPVTIGRFQSRPSPWRRWLERCEGFARRCCSSSASSSASWQS